MKAREAEKVSVWTLNQFVLETSVKSGVRGSERCFTYETEFGETTTTLDPIFFVFSIGFIFFSVLFVFVFPLICIEIFVVSQSSLLNGDGLFHPSYLSFEYSILEGAIFTLSLRRPVKCLFGFVWVLFLRDSIIVKLTSKVPEKEKGGSIKPFV